MSTLSLQQELGNFVTIADLYLEYRFSLEDIKKSHDRIDAVVKNILENNIDVSSLSGRFQYSQDHGLLYQRIEKYSCFLAVQHLLPLSFEKIVEEFSKEGCSYEEQINIVTELRDEAKAFLDDFDKLEKRVNNLLEKHNGGKEMKVQTNEIVAQVLQQEQENLIKLADIFLEYRLATEERLRQQDRINKVAQKIIDHKIDISWQSPHFEYSQEYGLLYKMSENSFALAVQHTPQKVSFAEVMKDLEIAKYSYQEKEDFIRIRCDEAKAFLKDFDELEKMVNQLTEEKPMTEVCIMPGTSLNFAMSALKELAKEKGNACFAKFNEKTITSDMTLNEAYIKCTGMPLNEEENLNKEDIEPER